MGWKIVRDGNEAWGRAHGVSGQWRGSPHPKTALLKKIFEEAGEYAESLDPEELYDLRDVIDRLVYLVDADGSAWKRHVEKAARLGMFNALVEWTPVPKDVIDEVYGD